MIIHYTITGTLEVPEGSKLGDSPREITLPTGDRIKLWEILELNDLTDLTNAEVGDLECFLNYGSVELDYD